MEDSLKRRVVKGFPCLYQDAESKVYFLHKKRGQKYFKRSLRTRSLPTARKAYAREIESFEEEVQNAMRYQGTKTPSRTPKNARIKYQDGLELSFGMRMAAGQKLAKRKTLVGYLERLREETLPLWAHKTVAEIHYPDVKEWIRNRERGSGQNVLIALRRVFDDMISHDRRNGVQKLVDNPAAGLKPPPPVRKKASVITLADVRQTLAKIKTVNPYCYDYYIMCVLSGATPDETRRMRVEHINIVDEVLTVQQVDTRHNTNSYRKGPMNKQLLHHVMAVLKKLKKAKPRDLVFEALPDKSRLSYLLQNVSQSLGLKRVHIGNLQPIYIQAGIHAGLNPVQIAKLIGHKDHGALICQSYSSDFLNYPDLSTRITIDI